jgi:DNA polymerase III sliding clamp (beta) subunit (PCNA family)
MFSQSMSGSAPNYEQVYPTEADNKGTIAGGSLKKGLDRLTRVLERRVDRQIMTAQIRAYDNSEVDSNEIRYT